MFSLLLSNEKRNLETPSDLIIPCVNSCKFCSVTKILVAPNAKNLDVSPTYNVKFDWKAALQVADFHPRMLFSIEKILFCGWPTLV